MSSINQAPLRQTVAVTTVALTYHFANGILGLVQLLTGSVYETLGISDTAAGSVSLIASVIHSVADILQSVPLGGQSVVDVVQAIHQTSVHICGVKGHS